MAASDANTDSKKTMDVATSGNNTPDTSARPVIVGHKPMVKDPMVKLEDKEEITLTKQPEIEQAIHTTKTIQPLTVTVDEPEKTETDPEVAEQPVTPDTAETTANASTGTETQEESSEEPQGDSATSNESAEVDALAEQAEAANRAKGEPSEEQKKQQELFQKLIAEKKYFVPIGQVTRRRKNRQAAIVLVLLIVAAGAGFYLHQKGYF